MSKLNPFSTSWKLTVAALLFAVVGIVVQISSGVDFPTIPPGLIILPVAAALVAFIPKRWSPVVGVIVGLFLLFGFFASGQIPTLLDPSWLGRFIGMWLLFLSLVGAVVAGFVATVQNYRR